MVMELVMLPLTDRGIEGERSMSITRYSEM